MFKRLFFLLAGVGLIGWLAGALLYSWLVVFDPGEQIRHGNIEKILAVESPVFYRGGVEKIGVFFETSHRQYISYEQIPQDFVKSIVASEDQKFFSHHGFDLLGVLRAIAANVRAGRVVQGGSTITQQTAKNLFKRRDRSIFSKLKELLFALRLEYHYPKEKILEFYANQFYVSGNGRGLGVASRYYFDKEVSELDLLECAFIAGSVKRPNYYNPFTKTDEVERVAARERARQRVRYVLGQMYRNGMITAEEHDRAVVRPIPFKQGKMSFSLNTAMDLVKEAMSEPEIDEVLRDHGIDNVATSGVRIFTSIEKGLQEESLRILRRELSRLDTILRGYNREEVQREYLALDLDDGLRDFTPGTFHFGRVARIEPGQAPRVVINLIGAPEGAPAAVADEKGLMNLLGSLVKHTRQYWAEAGKNDLPMLLERLKVGDVVYVSVSGYDQEREEIRLDLERYPELQGAILALGDGMIRAMVGGMENRHYNRAISARRAMGSVVKPMVYFAAMQLGWNNLDVLDNERDVFVYQNKPYFPRPDHTSPFKEVSMAWAGVHSENVATVWLLYHLCDRMSPGQFREVVSYLGLDRLPEESDAAYRRRVRDRLGITVDDNTFSEVAFAKAVAELEPDLIFSGRLSEYEIISRLHYGTNFTQYLETVDVDLGLEGEDDEGADVAGPVEKDRDYLKREREAELRRSILRRNYLRLLRLRDELDSLRDVTSVLVQAGSGNLPTFLYHDSQSGNYLFLGQPEETNSDGGTTADRLKPPPLPSEWRMVTRSELGRIIGGLDLEGEEDFWSGIMVDNLLAAETIDLIRGAVSREYQKIRDLTPYSPEMLYEVRDFKVLVGLQYIISLCRAMGIESRLDPVLSFPLGSNVISLLEVARAYEGMLTGSVSLNSGSVGPGLAIIESIENSEGEIIYQAERVERRLAAPETVLSVTDIMRQVIKHGTGRYADRNVSLTGQDKVRSQHLSELGVKVPVVGKTGTANRFTNAGFAGGVPGLRSDGFFSFPQGYVLTTYVGYDDNKPMVRKSTHVTGALGALPMWTEVANRILLENNYASAVDIDDVSFSGITEYPLLYPNIGQVEVQVDQDRGGIPGHAGGAPAAILSFGDFLGGDRLRPTRFFQPFWLQEEN